MNGSELILIVIGLAILLVIFVLFVKFFRQIMLALATTAILGIGAFALISQAGATRETAKAAKTAATAATVASAGQTANTMILAMLSGVLIVVTLIALGGAGYFFIRARRLEAQANRDTRRNTGDWRSGPNALWGRNDASQLPADADGKYQSVGDGSGYLLPLMLQQLMGMQAMMMQAWIRPESPRPTAPPRQTDISYPPQQGQLGWGNLDGQGNQADWNDHAADDPISLNWDW
ncbi:MAG TPA: hypothetical protein ENN19_05000 [Chloroflexi bacterium]|nr:hypothetical protein [Chloroflexota bacterium]